MLKGTPQQQRDSAWHERHLIKRTRRATVHAYNMATMKRESLFRTAQTNINQRKAYKVADAHRDRLSFWQRMVLLVQRFLAKIASLFTRKHAS